MTEGLYIGHFIQLKKMTETMPAIFLGHGNPMNALQTNAYTKAWAALGTDILRPKAILSISAHWYIDKTAITAMPEPKTIHDFGDFPRNSMRLSIQLQETRYLRIALEI